MSKSPLYMVTFRPEGFSLHSGLEPIAWELGVESLLFANAWSSLQKKSWRLGNALRQWGIRTYGSSWNGLVPWWDECRFLRKLPHRQNPYPVHFIWGEYGSPRNVKPYRQKGGRVIVSVHCSARRWHSVWLRPDGYAHADHVVLTSESQRPFVAQDVESERIEVIPLGADISWFRPPSERQTNRRRFRLWLIGNTERDHEFAARIASKLPEDRFEWRIRTSSYEKSVYAGISGVNLLPRLSDGEMLEEYQQADVLAMPMLDSAANDVILESMACGTPVMVNRVGGVPEYVDPACNYVMSNDRNTDEWVEKLLWLEQNRGEVERMRPATRAWAERFDWTVIADDYRKMYRNVLARG